MNKQQPLSSSIASTEDIASLLEFQDRLLNLVHSEVYAHQPVDDDALVRFQINHITEVNDAWKRMIDDLLFRLVKQRMPYESTLRDHFHKVLVADFLPCIRINRHELAQVSLFGFDIYIEPLSAILQIINRIDGQKHILTKQKESNAAQKKWALKPSDVWQSIKVSWNEFIYCASLCKISVHVYVLKEYLKMAAQSLVKKDKEIIFTGCMNLFTQMVPSLKQNRELWLLIELAQLNNQLYNFHPSFNYSHFYSLMLPLQKHYKPVFQPLRVVAGKCLSANILTPFLFALMRNRPAFHQFIEQVDDQCWAGYLNGLVFALIYNFKARILEYEEVMEIMVKAIIKLGVLGALQTQCFLGQLGKEWAEARDFFISALKIGYNIGELQTWHSTDSQSIQERIIFTTKQSLLMHPYLPAGCPIKIFFAHSFEDELQGCLQSLTTNLLNRAQFTTSYSSNIAEAISIGGEQINNLLKIAHLVELCKLSKNANCICYVICFLNRVEDVPSQLYKQRLGQIGDKFCEAAIKQLEVEGKARDDIKQVLFNYMKKNKQISKIYQLIQVFLVISSPKEAVSEILSLVQSSQATEQQQSEDLVKFVAANMVAVYCPERLGSQVRVKTFEKEYTIESDIINIPNKLNSCLTVLVQELITKESGAAKQILVWMVNLCNWLVIPLLGFPVSLRYDRNSQNKKLQSFSIFMISTPGLHSTLLELVAIGLTILQSSIKTYFMQICLTTVSDQIVMEINTVLSELANVEDNNQYRYILELITLFMRVLQLSTGRFVVTNNAALLKKVLKLYLRAVEKLNDTLINSQDESIGRQVQSSFTQIYCPLINILLEGESNCRKWRACMKKTCLVSLDITVEHISNLRDFELPSTRKDKGFLIHNSIEYSKESSTNGPINLEKIRRRAQDLLKQPRNTPVIGSKQESLNFYKPDYLITAKQVKEINSSKLDSKLTSKQFLLPPVSLKLIRHLCSEDSDVDNLMVDLLSMTPSSHHKLTEFALLMKNKAVLFSIGLSKQTVESLLSQILVMVPHEELSRLVDGLDQQSRKNISDNFNLMLARQHYQEQEQQHKLVLDLSGALGFLVVLNQSNWRFLNEITHDLAIAKVNGLETVPSLLLQYQQYIRITGLPNRDYEDRFSAYSEIVSAYSSLLQQKLEYLMSIQSTVQTNLTKELQNCITAEELRLFKLNELAYMGSFCEAFNVKDVLNRAADLRNHAGRISTQSNGKATNQPKFEQLIATIDRIVESLSHINKIVNQVAEGSVVCPDFLFSYRLCSDGAYIQAKIRLGQNLQSYQIKVEQKAKDSYIYQPKFKTCSLLEYLNKIKIVQKSNSKTPVLPKLGTTKEANDCIRLLTQRFTQLQQTLLQMKLIDVDKETKEMMFCSQDNNQNSDQHNCQTEKLLFDFGVLYRCMEMTGQEVHLGKIKSNFIVSLLRKRQKLEWQALKHLNVEAYHHIKAILVDDEVQSRKIKFEYKGQALFSQHGSSIEVNKLNRQIYCNLVAKLSIGLKVWTRACSFTQGLTSVY